MVIPVGEKRLGGKMEKKERNITADANRAYIFSLKSINGGNKLSHNPTSYGIALKWLIYVKGLTYAQFAQRYNGTTAQNANHLINRVGKDGFVAENLEKMCSVLNVEYDYLISLCEEIEKRMGDKCKV